MKISQPSIRLSGAHCCVCSPTCDHIGPMQLCDRHGPDHDALLDRLARALLRDRKILRRLV